MSVLVFIDHSEGQIKKTSLEALSYGAALGKQMAVPAEGVLLGNVKEDLSSLGKYGIQKIHQLNQESLNQLDAEQYIRIIATIAESSGCNCNCSFPYQYRKSHCAGFVRPFKSGSGYRGTELPDTSNGFQCEEKCFFRESFLYSFH